MEVELIAYTPNPLEVMYGAARTCYSAKTPQELYEETLSLPQDKMINFISKVLASGHTSIAEHINFTFAISGITRACSHQLVRHRHCTFSQQSQRYVKLDEYSFNLKLPVSITNLDGYDGDDFKDLILGIYKDLIDKGVAPEDARGVLPNATTTNLVVTINLRELIFICGKRLCKRSQSEIRLMVNFMANKVVAQLPFLNQYLKPQCDQLGYCPEEKCCGRKKKLNELP